jgi:hypothetical protein
MMDAYDDTEGDEEEDELEAYCMSCRQSNPIEDAQPVWTRKGSPATRGVCSVCGTTVFRMGGTPAHKKLKPPAPVRVAGPSVKRGPMAHLATFVAHAPQDTELARRLAEDLKNTGYPTWLEEAQPDEQIAWASGVHPALSECTRMVVVLSPASLASELVTDAWQYFRDNRKPVLLAQVEPVEVPDGLRRSPRFDFSTDYKAALRQLVQALMQ